MFLNFFVKMENTLPPFCDISPLLYFQNAGEKYSVTITNEQCGVFILLEYFFIYFFFFFFFVIAIIVSTAIMALFPMFLGSFSFFFTVIPAGSFWYLLIISCVAYCIWFLTFSLPVRQRGLALTVASNDFGPLVNFHQLFLINGKHSLVCQTIYNHND